MPTTPNVVPLVVLLIATFGADIGPFTTAVAVFGAGAVTPDGALAVAGFAPVAVGWQYADDRVNDTQPYGSPLTVRPAAGLGHLAGRAARRCGPG